MPVIDADGLFFSFPAGWKIVKFDDWAFYRSHFACMREGVKAVDILAITPDKAVLWLIEAKDFRFYRRSKGISLHEEIWKKVFDTLAALLPAGINASNNDELEFAKTALRVSRLRVVFHGEQPRKPSKLFPQSFDPADLQKKFKAIFKAIDPHPLVVSCQNMPSAIEWKVQPKKDV